jgi:hypothetical protein
LATRSGVYTVIPARYRLLTDNCRRCSDEFDKNDESVGLREVVFFFVPRRCSVNIRTKRATKMTCNCNVFPMADLPRLLEHNMGRGIRGER